LPWSVQPPVLMLELGSRWLGVSFLISEFKLKSDEFLSVTHNLGSESKRATGISLCGAIGQGGSILGSHLYPLTEQPEYR